MKQRNLLIMLLMIFSSSIFAQSVTVDHRHTDISKIPVEWIEKVKEMHLNIIGESHGGGYVYGLDSLSKLTQGNQRDYSTIVNFTGDPAARTGEDLIVSKTYYYLRNPGDANPRISNSAGEEDFWTSPEALARMDYHLNYSTDVKNNPVDAFIFGWCWDMTAGTEVDGLWQGTICTDFAKRDTVKPWDINTTEINLYNYINAVEHYITNHPNTTTVFSTGPVDGGSNTRKRGYQRFLKNEEIRNYVKNSNNKIYLFDYADILTHNESGNQFIRTDYEQDYPFIVTDYNGNYSNHGQVGCHINAEATLKLANALWYLMARIAGWNGEESGEVVGITDLSVLKSGKTEITLEWNAPTNTIIQNYNIYRNGEFYTTSSTDEYTDSNIPTGYYNYQVSYVNGNGEESELTIASTNIVIKAEENSIADIYVGGWEADNEFSLSAEEIELLKSKTIILGSRSYGLNVSKGINRIIPNFTSSRKPAQGEAVEDNFFDQYPMLNYMCDLYNRTARLREFESFYNDDSHTSTWQGTTYNYNFSDDVEIAFLEIWAENNASDDGYLNVYNSYKTMMENLQIQFPNITFVFYSHQVNFKQALDGQVELENDQTFNLAAKNYNELFFKEILGNYPIYDFGDIVSTKTTGEIETFVYENEVYRKAWPEYNIIDNVHPNTVEIEERLGKGFLTVLKKIMELKEDETAPEILSVDASLQNRIDVTFNESVNVNNASFVVNPTVTISSVSLAISPKVVSIYTAENLTVGETYQLTVSNVEDISGNIISPASQSFDFEVTGIPVIQHITPVTVNEGGAVSVQVVCDGNKTYQISFLNQDELTGATFVDNGNNTGLFTWVPATRGVYSARFSATDGIATSEEVSLSITVVDVTPPTIVENKVLTNQTIEVTFSEPLQPTTTEIVSNYSIDNNIGIASVAHSLEKIIITLSDATPLQTETTYTLTVNNVEDLSHNAVDANTRTSFIYEEVITSNDILVQINFNNNIENQIDNQLTTNWQNGEGTYTAGYNGMGLSLNGLAESPQVIVNRNDDIQNLEKATVSLWAKKADASSGGLLFIKHINFRLEVHGSRITGYLFADANRINFDINNLEQVNNTDWHFYELVYDGASVSILVDGVVVDNQAASGPIRGGSDYQYDIIIGKNPWGSAFNGVIDDFELKSNIQVPETYSLTVTGENGSVTKSPNQQTYVSGTQVQLTATPNEGFIFNEWTGDITGSDNPISIAVTENMNVTANFVADIPEEFTLTLDADNGYINSDPELENYMEGSTVELTAVADEGYLFSSWIGDITGTDNPITVKIDSNMSVTANFISDVIIPTESDTVINITFENSIENQITNGINPEWQNGEAPFIAGNDGLALQLDGTREGSYVLIRKDDRLDNFNNVVISIDAKKNNASGGGMLFIKHVAYRMIISGTTLSGYVFVSGTRVNYTIRNIEQINNTDWHQYQLLFDGSILTFVVDGTPVETIEVSGNILTDSDHIYDLIVGRHPWGTSFDGAIDNFAISIPTALGKKGQEYISESFELPTEYELAQNYPNPFNPTTVIDFAIPNAGMVTLKVYSLVGEEVATLVNESKQAGRYQVNFNASNLSSGIYVYRIVSGSFISNKKMILLK